jgi:hypothetical protein
MIRCGFCGHEFAEEEGIRGCGGCGKPTACANIRCPRCNYENPLEPAYVKKISAFFSKRQAKGDGDPPEGGSPAENE